MSVAAQTCFSLTAAAAAAGSFYSQIYSKLLSTDVRADTVHTGQLVDLFEQLSGSSRRSAGGTPCS
jgi:hypothetical protein